MSVRTRPPRSSRRARAAVLVALALLLPAQAALAAHSERESSGFVALGESLHVAQFLGVPAAERNVSSDIAFWGRYAYHGNYDGFRIIDISNAGRPREVSWQHCNGDQGDVVVWGNILVRSWNAPAPPGRFCDGQPVPVGFEGVHVFDVSDPAAPILVATVEFSENGAATRGTADGCGSHTLTLVPDLANGRIIVYSNNSSGGNRAVCDAIDVLQIPIAAPSAASHIGKVPLLPGSLGSNNGCHDAGVLLGSANLMACASGHAANVFSIGSPRGGSPQNPVFLYAVEEADGAGGQVGVGGRWHSAAFSWDGAVLVLGWEPGGGAAGECEASDPAIDKSLFFYDAATGAKLGQWVLPRAQDATENCTVHNYNVVPLRDGRDVAVVSAYQGGTWIVEFTDPANPVALAYSDPAPDDDLAGAWSSYWYNDVVYESSIGTGLHLFRASSGAFASSARLPHLNPQTQEFTI